VNVSFLPQPCHQPPPCPPAQPAVPSPVLQELLTLRGVPWREVDDLREVAADVDVLYMTRIQKERFTNMQVHKEWLTNMHLRVCPVRRSHCVVSSAKQGAQCAAVSALQSVCGGLLRGAPVWG